MKYTIKIERNDEEAYPYAGFCKEQDNIATQAETVPDLFANILDVIELINDESAEVIEFSVTTKDKND